MAKNKAVAPFLKWAGGKRQLVQEIGRLLPPDLSGLTFYEPFIGGGALLFELEPARAVINDYNGELINVYRVIKESPEELIGDLERHVNTAEYYYKIRGLDRGPAFGGLTPVQRASRIIYLNKTCFNGLYRVNAAGEFNVPFGRYKNPNIVNAAVIRAVSEYLNTADVRILDGDYEAALGDISRQSFVYLDPPYHPLSVSSSFTGYVQGGWGEADQVRLRDVCNALDSKGVKFMLSNSSAPFIREIYAGYDIRVVRASRAINADSGKRGQVDEFIIRNYE